MQGEQESYILCPDSPLHLPYTQKNTSSTCASHNKSAGLYTLPGGGANRLPERAWRHDAKRLNSIGYVEEILVSGDEDLGVRRNRRGQNQLVIGVAYLHR